MKKIFLLNILIIIACGLHAANISVTTSDFVTKYDAAVDGDVLLLADGTYGSDLNFPNGKTITLKAANGASPVLSGKVGATTGTTGGGLILDGVNIDRNTDYWLDANTSGQLLNVKILAFRNLTIQRVNRCLVRTTAATTDVIDAIEFDNCIIKDCGSNGYNFIYPKHTVKSVSVKNSTLYNYTNGESFFLPNQANTDNVFEFTFENNTVYKWAKSSDRALCNTSNKYSASSTYTFKNNIITVPGVAGQKPKALNASSGTVNANNNLITADYDTYYAGTKNVNDLTLEGLGLSALSFPDPDNGDFSILSSSVLATAGVGGACIGDPRWIKTVATPANLVTTVSPAGAGSVSPVSATYEQGETATVTATHNYGYRFTAWQKNGVQVSTENPYSFTITEDQTLTAVFEAIPTYTLTINTAGDGAEWGRIKLTPEPVNGIYETDETVTASIIPNSVSTFLYWEDMTGSPSRQVVMTENKTLTATFDWKPFLVAWSFDPSEPRGNRPGDFYSRSDNTGIMRFFNGDGSSTNWGGSTKAFGGTTYTCARRYTNYADMSNPRYFQAEFSAKGADNAVYKNIRVTSYIASDNACVHSIQKMQWATDPAGPFADLQSINMTPYHNAQWVECSATLPDDLTEDEKEKIYIRWIGDTGSNLLGSPSSSDTEGFYLANVTVYADIEQAEDHDAPVLLSTVPGSGTATASANGTIVLSFNERVIAGANEGKITLNGETLTPTFGNKTVTYPYQRLDYGTAYAVTIPAGTITDMSGNAYEGKQYTFTTMARPQPAERLYDAIVAADGSGNYTSIQAAIDAAPAGRAIPWLIFIKNGSYRGNVVIPATKPFIHLIGQDKEQTIIHEKMNSQSRPDPSSSYYANDLAAWPYSVNNPESPMYQKEGGSVVKANATDFYAENITFRNDWGVEAQNGPMALAMYSCNDRFAFYNCKFRSFQDTWQTKAKNTNDRTYVYNSWIEGAVDYFYGDGNTFLDECTLYNMRSGSVIVAPSHKPGTLWGYVFNSCTIDGNTAAADGKQKLGRPWHDVPQAVYLNSTMNIPIAPEGWTNMGVIPKIFAEYNSMDKNGNAIDLSNRKTCYTQSAGEGGQTICGVKAVLTTEEAAAYTYEAIVNGQDGWNPRAFFEPVGKPANIQISDNTLSWTASNYAICYVVYKNDSITAFTTATSYQDASMTGTDIYKVRPVNEYGSLGETSDAVQSNGTVIRNREIKQYIFENTGYELIIRNVETNANISLYTVGGQLLQTLKPVFTTARIPSGSLKGVYVISIGEKSFKVIL